MSWDETSESASLLYYCLLRRLACSLTPPPPLSHPHSVSYFMRRSFVSLAASLRTEYSTASRTVSLRPSCTAQFGNSFPVSFRVVHGRPRCPLVFRSNYSHLTITSHKQTHLPTLSTCPPIITGAAAWHDTIQNSTHRYRYRYRYNYKRQGTPPPDRLPFRLFFFFSSGFISPGILPFQTAA